MMRSFVVAVVVVASLGYCQATSCPEIACAQGTCPVTDADGCIKGCETPSTACFVDPCQLAVCEGHPEAECEWLVCEEGCTKQFVDAAGNKVQCGPPATGCTSAEDCAEDEYCQSCSFGQAKNACVPRQRRGQTCQAYTPCMATEFDQQCLKGLVCEDRQQIPGEPILMDGGGKCCEPRACDQKCERGYTLDEDGCMTCECLPDPTCPKNAEWDTCGTSCPNVCGKPKPDACTDDCNEGCFCKEGFVRRSIVAAPGFECVPEEECECASDDECEDNEYCETCAGGSFQCRAFGEAGSLCGGMRFCRPLEAPSMCGSGFECKDVNNMMMVDGPGKCCPSLECLAKLDCPAGVVKDDNGCPTCECAAVPECPEHATFTECGSACPASCDDNPDEPVFCKAMCVAGCACDEGYVIVRGSDDKDPNDFECVLRDECPPSSCASSADCNLEREVCMLCFAADGGDAASTNPLVGHCEPRRTEHEGCGFGEALCYPAETDQECGKGLECHLNNNEFIADAGGKCCAPLGDDAPECEHGYVMDTSGCYTSQCREGPACLSADDCAEDQYCQQCYNKGGDPSSIGDAATGVCLPRKGQHSVCGSSMICSVLGSDCQEGLECFHAPFAGIADMGGKCCQGVECPATDSCSSADVPVVTYTDGQGCPESCRCAEWGELEDPTSRLVGGILCVLRKYNAKRQAAVAADGGDDPETLVLYDIIGGEKQDVSDTTTNYDVRFHATFTDLCPIDTERPDAGCLPQDIGVDLVVVTARFEARTWFGDHIECASDGPLNIREETSTETTRIATQPVVATTDTVMSTNSPAVTSPSPTSQMVTSDSPFITSPTSDSPAVTSPTTKTVTSDSPAVTSPTTKTVTSDSPAVTSPTTKTVTSDSPAVTSPTTKTATSDSPAVTSPSLTTKTVTSGAPSTSSSSQQPDSESTTTEVKPTTTAEERKVDSWIRLLNVNVDDFSDAQAAFVKAVSDTVDNRPVRILEFFDGSKPVGRRLLSDTESTLVRFEVSGVAADEFEDVFKVVERLPYNAKFAAELKDLEPSVFESADMYPGVCAMVNCATTCRRYTIDPDGCQRSCTCAQGVGSSKTDTSTILIPVVAAVAVVLVVVVVGAVAIAKRRRDQSIYASATVAPGRSQFTNPLYAATAQDEPTGLSNPTYAARPFASGYYEDPDDVEI